MLDVVADWVAFGLAPVILILAHLPFSSGAWIALTVPFGCAWPLLRSCLSFAMWHDHYMGLPMPAVGGLLLGMVFVLRGVPISLSAIVVSALAVWWISYPSLGWLSRNRPGLLTGLVLFAATGSLLSPWIALLLIASGYAALPWLQRMHKPAPPFHSDWF